MTTPPRRILCPYCGNKTPETEERCVSCGGFFDDLSRRVTQQHMGPWFVRDPEHPFRPGCSYAVIAKQVEKGKITAKTILRGPTTRQFWAMAGNTPGVAHLLGVCHACTKPAPRHAQACSHCGAAFPRPDDRNEMGLDAENARVFEEAAKAKAEFAATQAAAQLKAATEQPAPAPRAAAAATSSRPAAATSTAAPPRPPVPASAARATASAPTPATATATVTASPAQPDLDSVSWMTGEGYGQVAATAPAESPEPRGGNRWVWALVAVNMLLAVGVVLVLLRQEPPDTDHDSVAPPVNPFNDPAPSRIDPPRSDETVVVSTTPEPTNNPPADPLAPQPNGTAPGVGTTPAEQGPSGAVSFFGIKSVGPTAAVPQAVIDDLNRRFAEGNEIYKQGRFDDALAHFQKLRDDVPKQINAVGLDAVIDQVRDAADRARKDKKNPSGQGDDFFDS